jgi:predicted dehydrogenase
MKYLVLSILIFCAAHLYTSTAPDAIQKENEQRQLSIGVIGMGVHMMEKLIPALDPTKFKVVFACRRNLKELEKQIKDTNINLIKDTNINLTSNFYDLFSRSNVDVLIVAGPPEELHVPVLREALKAGVHIFVEKPVSLFLERNKELLELAKRSKSKVMVGFNFTHTQSAEDVAKKYKANQISNLHITCQLGPNSFGEKTADANFESIFDNDYYFAFIHAVSVLTKITGKPTEIKQIESLRNQTTNDYSFTVACVNEALKKSPSKEAKISFLKSTTPGFKLVIEFTNDVDGKFCTIDLNDKNPQSVNEKAKSYKQQFDEFYRNIVEDKTPENSLERNLEIHETLEAIREKLTFFPR